jgi:hypothetical protein
MVGRPTGASVWALLHAEWDGQRWHEPSVVSLAPPYAEYPRLSISQGNQLHLVWFGGDKESIDRNPVGIWYSTLQTRAPAKVNGPAATAKTPTTGTASTASTATPSAQPTAAEPGLRSAEDSGSALPFVQDGLSQSPLLPMIFAIVGSLALLVLVPLAKAGLPSLLNLLRRE